MAGVTWRGGRNVSDLARFVVEAGEDFKDRANEALAMTVEEAANDTQDILEAAITKTGRERVRSGTGQFAGRHDTGNMVGSVSHNGDRLQRLGKIVVGAWGWFASDFEQYFRDQDLGEGRIPAARALEISYIRAVERFKVRMGRVAGGGRARG
jgi:hypothetical protein